jgi:hypothetical protein
LRLSEENISVSALVLITRALREKDYSQVLGCLNAIPKDMQLKGGAERNALRDLLFEMISDDFHHTPEAGTMQMKCPLK